MSISSTTINQGLTSPTSSKQEEIIEVSSAMVSRMRAGEKTEETAAVASAVQEVFEGFTTPVFEGEENINQCDKDGNFLRYKFPKLSLIDLFKSVPSGLQYPSTSASLLRFEESVGCYAKIMLGKTLEQSEDDYEVVLKELNCEERHALHTHSSRDWFAAFERKFYPTTYWEKSKERREKQISGMQKTVDFWEKTGLFNTVFIPDAKYRVNVLHHCPEYVACTDEIILTYQPVAPIHIPLDAVPELLTVEPSLGPIQLAARERYDLAARPLYKKMVEQIYNSLPWNQPRSRMISINTTFPSEPAALDSRDEAQASSASFPRAKDFSTPFFFTKIGRAICRWVSSFFAWISASLRECFRR